MKNDPLISIGAISKRTGCAVSAIRYYADEELIPSVRSAAGHRLFTRSVIRRVSFILIAQNLGYTLVEIKQLLESLPERRTPSKLDWQQLSESMLAELEHKIEQLTRIKLSLTGCIGCGCLSLESCALYNPDDRISEKGTGARYLLGNKYSDLKP